MTNPASLTHEIAQEALTDALRLFVGLRKPWSVDGLAEATGIDSRTVKSYRDGDRCPDLARLLRLCAVLGPDFTNRVLEPAGLSGAAVMDATTDHLALNRDAAETLSGLACALADGRVDHREEAELEPQVRRLHAACAGWLNRRVASRLGEDITAAGFRAANERSA